MAGTWKDLTDAVNVMAANLTDQVRNIAQVSAAVARGDLSQKITVEARGEVAGLAETINDMTDTLAIVRRPGDRRGPRGGHRGQAGRPGRRAERRRHLEGPDRLGEHDGGEPDDPGALDRRGDDRGRERRPVAEDRGRDQGRGRDAGGDHQHDGRPALVVRRRGHARRARGRHRRHPGRPGAGRGRQRHVARPDRVGQPARVEPDRPGAQHRAGDDGGRPRRPDAEDHRRGARRGRRAGGHDQRDDRHARDASPSR